MAQLVINEKTGEFTLTGKLCAPRPSSTGKNVILATASEWTSATFKGQPVKVGLNLYCPPPAPTASALGAK